MRKTKVELIEENEDFRESLRKKIGHYAYLKSVNNELKQENEELKQTLADCCSTTDNERVNEEKLELVKIVLAQCGAPVKTLNRFIALDDLSTEEIEGVKRWFRV